MLNNIIEWLVANWATEKRINANYIILDGICYHEQDADFKMALSVLAARRMPR
jgi:hypothetical protein